MSTQQKRHQDLVTSCVIGYGGEGIVDLFKSCLGQKIPWLADAYTRSNARSFIMHNEYTTDLTRIGEFGTSIGDFDIHEIHCEYVGACLDDIDEIWRKTWFKLLVAGAKVVEGSLNRLPKRLPEHPIHCARTDAVDLLVGVANGEKIERLRVPILLKFMLRGIAYSSG